VRFSTIILAAGEGRRIGIPKAILNVNGKNLADIQYEFFSSFNIYEIKIVIGAEAERVGRLLEHNESLVVNERYKDGQFSSLIKGINSLNSCEGVLIIPVDVYPLEREVVQRLLSEFELNFDAIIPVFGKRRGHPVILSYEFAGRLTDYDVINSRLDHILKGAYVKTVAVNSPSVLYNINEASDLEERL